MPNHNKRLLCALTAALLLLSLLGAPTFAAAEDAADIHIRTADDLIALAENCSLDTWSDGRTVILDQDISLAGRDFSPIPIFNGTFDGGGHAIVDLGLNASMSPCGLFVQTGADAQIRALSVSGTVAPGTEDSLVGGIVGLNLGQISDCSFSGRVEGKSEVGGVVGKNAATGLLTNCRSAGTVFGLGQVGGVAGSNEGTLIGCENRSFINTVSVDPSLNREGLDTSSLVNLIRSLTTENADITTNIGGVAGENLGIMELCRNEGTVGYLHLGFNVGGIAGRSSGLLRACTGSGDVYGRNNVGGIVGRSEPLVEASQAQNLLSGLAYRMSALNYSIDKAIADAGDQSKELISRLSGLNGQLVPVRDAIAGIDPEDPDTIEALRSALAAATGEMYRELDGITGELDGGSDKLLEDLHGISDSLNALSGTAMQAMSLLSGAQQSGDILEDGSAEDDESIVLGKVADCVNEGAVQGDSQVGGIAGTIGMENDGDWSKLTGSEDNKLIQNRYSLHCVIARCVNRAAVSARHECAGGIVGRMDFGFVTGCEAYGSVSLEDGSYAGGVCGLCYGRVSASCVKATLSGKKYVGGVLGNGFTASGDDERSSFVSGCYVLAQILDRPQFAAAVSGGGDGVYENNYFVPAGYAGLDRLSIHGMAEPMDYADFAAVPGLPEECLTLTLTFTVEGVPVKTIPFAYGDSFDRSVFPTPEAREGVYPVWDRTDLSDLRFDTVVNAEYRTNLSVLRSELTREDGRPAVYVDGRFQDGDAVLVEQLAVSDGDIEAFRSGWRGTVREQLDSIFVEKKPDYSVCTAVTEKLKISFPEDGLAEHRIRCLTPDMSVGNCRVYLREGEGWRRLETEAFGSYLLITVPGSGAELAFVRTIQSWWIAAYAAGALLLLALLVLLLAFVVKKLKARPRKKREPLKKRIRLPGAKKKALRITAVAAALVAAAVAAVVLLTGSLGVSLSAGRLLRSFSREETAIRVEVTIGIDGREIPLNTTVRRVSRGGTMVSCADRFGIPLYFADGRVYLENGRAFQVADSRLDQSTVMDLAKKVFTGGELTKEAGAEGTLYRADIRGETADRILALFVGGEYQGLVRAEELTAEMAAADGRVLRLSFTGHGQTESGSAFTLRAELKPEAMTERPVIPQAVIKAMGEHSETTEVLTEDLLALFAAWMKYDAAEHLDAEITLRAEGGLVSADTSFGWFRQKLGDTPVHCVTSPLFSIYFTDKAACTADGRALPGTDSDARDASRLIAAARELCLAGKLSCAHEGELRSYTLSLNGSEAGELAEELFPRLRGLGVSYGENSLCIMVRDGELSALSFRCDGEVRIVSRSVETELEVTARFVDSVEHRIPASVQEALLG